MAESVSDVRYAINRLHERLDNEFRLTTPEEPAAFREVRDLEWALRRLLRDAVDWQTRWRAAHRHPVSRWDLEGEEARIQLEKTPPGAPECNTCGHPFETDADFWKHYVVTNVEYPSLGACWTRLAIEYAGTRPEWVLRADADEMR